MACWPWRWPWSPGAKQRWRMAQVVPYHQATLFFALQFLFMLGFILFFVGGQWRETRYLFLVQPAWLLVGAAGAVWAIDWLIARLLPSVSVAAGLAVGCHRAGCAAPGAQPMAAGPGGAGAAGRRLRQGAGLRRSSSGSPATSSCRRSRPPVPLSWGRATTTPCRRCMRSSSCPRGWRPAANLSTAGPALACSTTPPPWQQVIRKSPAVWFITDRFRLATRYDEAFLRTVLEQFDISFEERGVVALRAHGWREQPDHGGRRGAARTPRRRPALRHPLGAQRRCPRPGPGRHPHLAGHRPHRPPDQHLVPPRQTAQARSSPSRTVHPPAASSPPTSSSPPRCRTARPCPCRPILPPASTNCR